MKRDYKKEYEKTKEKYKIIKAKIEIPKAIKLINKLKSENKTIKKWIDEKINNYLDE